MIKIKDINKKTLTQNYRNKMDSKFLLFSPFEISDHVSNHFKEMEGENPIMIWYFNVSHAIKHTNMNA